MPVRNACTLLAPDHTSHLHPSIDAHLHPSHNFIRTPAAGMAAYNCFFLSRRSLSCTPVPSSVASQVWVWHGWHGRHELHAAV